jgi:hypothetical protein
MRRRRWQRLQARSMFSWGTSPVQGTGIWARL